MAFYQNSLIYKGVVDEGTLFLLIYLIILCCSLFIYSTYRNPYNTIYNTINSICIINTEHKISQYADATLLVLDNSHKSLFAG